MVLDALPFDRQDTDTKSQGNTQRIVWCCHVLYEALKLCSLFLLKQAQILEDDGPDPFRL